MIEPADGLVIRYSYLWAREYDRREESGRKDRPACLQILMKGPQKGSRVLLFPITSTPAAVGQTALAIPALEARRARLKTPAWVIVDEFNIDNLATSPHIADVKPLGSFTAAFMQEIRKTAAERIRARKFRKVPRC